MDKQSSNFTFTENGDVALNSSGSFIMDAFYKIVRDTPKEAAHKIWEDSLNESKICSLLIAMFKRDCRGGQGEKIQTFYFLSYLKVNDIDLYKKYLKVFVELGSYKDLLALYGVEPIGEIELDIFKHTLLEDMKSDKPSLCAKYVPSEGKAFSNVFEALKKHMKWNNKTYRKNISALRNKLNLVETKMCEGKFDTIEYNKVPSRAMHIYNKCFSKKDPERYDEYIQDIRDGNAKININHIEPHEIVKIALKGNELSEFEENSWKEIVKQTKDSNSLKGTMAVVDVSGSMEGQPMEVAIALGLLIAECSGDSFRDRLLTFSKKSEFQTVKGDKLVDRVNSLSKFSWNTSTNIESSFESILTSYETWNVPKDNQIKRLVILSDMQFNSASNGKWAEDTESEETTMERMKKKFEAKGFELPNLIFWNLRSTHSVPVIGNKNGVILASGFNKEMLELFMVDDKEFSTKNIILRAIKKYTHYIDPQDL